MTSEGVSEQYDYTAFGIKLPGSGSLTDYAFTGQLAIAWSGLQYHRARWLDSPVGRWLSSDNILDYPNNYGSIYNYVKNPVNNYDLSGQVSLTESMITALFVSIIAQTESDTGNIIWAMASAILSKVDQKQILLNMLTEIQNNTIWAMIPALTVLVLGMVYIITVYLTNAALNISSFLTGAAGSIVSVVRFAGNILKIAKGYSKFVKDSLRFTKRIKSSPARILPKITPGVIYRRGLSDDEVNQVQKLLDVRGGGEFVGQPYPGFSGIDGWLDGHEVQLKLIQNTTEDWKSAITSQIRIAENKAREYGYSKIHVHITAEMATSGEIQQYAANGRKIEQVLSNDEEIVTMISFYTKDNKILHFF